MRMLWICQVKENYKFNVNCFKHLPLPSSFLFLSNVSSLVILFVCMQMNFKFACFRLISFAEVTVIESHLSLLSTTSSLIPYAPAKVRHFFLFRSVIQTRSMVRIYVNISLGPCFCNTQARLEKTTSLVVLQGKFVVNQVDDHLCP